MCNKKRVQKKKPSFPISVLLGGQVLQLGEEKNEDSKVTKDFLGGKVGPSWHFLINQIMGQILKFSTSPLTSSQIWLTPLVHNCQPTTSPAVFPTGHTTKSG
jgi:hypothetical protein